MDFRQFDFLARQPGAALRERRTFWGISKRGLAFILANMMFWQPLVAMADGIVANGPGTSVGQAGNGVPIVNIAAPNGSGLSHNTFNDYNVGQQGLILNNATDRTQATQLGGIILGNPNLNGRSANVILNEVNGGNPSQLRGYTEVAGQSAHVIVANPYGVTCNGCGFINTPKATLTTGKPVIENGQLQRYQVEQGSVAIEGAGLNASNIDQFEIITRSAKVNAQIQAKHLAMVTGANDVDARTLEAKARTAKAEDAPQLAIDASALGGMYANTIKLVGTEAGVGVKLDGKLIASGGDIQLDANGQLRLAEASAAQGSVAIDAASLEAQGTVYAGKQLKVRTQGDLSNHASLAAGERIDLASGARLTNHGIIEAGVNADDSRNAQGDVRVAAQHLDNRGKSLVASRDLSATVTQTLDNQGGTLSGRRQVSVDAGRLNNAGGLATADKHLSVSSSGPVDNRGGRIISLGSLDLKAGQVDNRNAGRIASNQALNTNVTGLDQQGGGRLSSASELSLDLNHGHLNNQDGLVSAPRLTLKQLDSVFNQQGEISSAQAFELLARSLDNSHGKLLGDLGLSVRLNEALNNVGGLIAAHTLDLHAANLDNTQGLVSSLGTQTLKVDDRLVNQGGTFIADGRLALQAADFDNRQGLVAGKGDVTLTGAALDNSDDGRVLADGSLALTVAKVLNQSRGLLHGRAGLSLKGTRLDNQGGTLSTLGDLDALLQGTLDNRKGLLSAEGTLGLASLDLDNRGGSVSSAGTATLAQGGALLNQGGAILTDGGLLLSSARLDNRDQGTLSAKGAASIATGALDNSQGGYIASADRLDVLAGQLTNQDGGRIVSTGALNASVTGLDQQGGKLASDSGVTLDLNHGLLNNRQGVISAPLLVLRNLDEVNNQAGEISSSQAFTLAARNVDNSAGKLISNAQLHIQAQRLINQGGLVSGWQGLSAELGSLDNRNQGTLSSRSANVNVQVTGALQNSGGGALVSQQTLNVTAAHLDNSAGILSSAGEQRLTVHGLLNNAQGGLIDSGAALTLNAITLGNVGGSINAQQALVLTANSLDNSAGSLAGNAAVTLNLLETLSNTQGKLASAGPLRLQGTAAVANQGGQIVSQGLLSLFANSLDNRERGTLAAKEQLNLVLAGALDNRNDGLVYSQGSGIDVQAASLINTKGTLQSQGTLSLSTGAVANDGGRIAARAGDTLVSTGNFDNRDGGLYAKGLVKVTGKQFDNSGDTHGQVAGQQVAFDLSGALNNRQGIIESDSALTIEAASLDNQAGQLRTLGRTGNTRFAIGGLLDNRSGTLESASHDLSLGAGSFRNAGGSLLHVGLGTFDIATGNVAGAGGSIVTQGSLTLNADSWSNSSVIQAGRLTVNVGSFSQTAAGQLLAGQALLGSGGNWLNDGLIASDGSLSLDLTGTYSGNGRLSSRDTLGVSTGQLTLGSAASIAGGADTSVRVAGQLNNAGRITSAGNLGLNAAGVHNQGTLGATGNLTLGTGALNNDRGLLFSGGDMALRVDSLLNSYADVYSLGSLTVDRDGQGGLASSIVNRSGTLQSDRSMSLAAASIQNLRAVLKTGEQGVYTARISEVACIEGYNAGDCSGKRNHVWEIVQRDKFEVTEASAASSITTGGNLAIKGGELINSSSTIAAAGNLTASVNNLTNTGVETGETETTRIFMSARTRNGGAWYDAANAVTSQYWYQSAGYNPNNLAGLQGALAGFIGMTELEWVHLGSSRTLAAGDQRYAGVMQAGGAVNVTAANGIDNSVVRPGYSYIGSGARTDTSAPGTAFSTLVSLNQQLPPDLAQQQLNPLALPGFALPSGQNGLFRLSGDGANAQAGNGANPRQQPLPQVLAKDLDTGGHASAAAPATLTGQATLPTGIARVQGLPDSSVRSNPHKYLIETNPALTDLKQFMSSDYLLANLGYDPDDSAKRLGDGFYEQRLIQQAVLARTGQRLIDGQDTDEKLFKHLMDNAIQSKQQLDLALGVSLTSAQVAALTHDIVWLENAEVNGEQVLVPVLYLANANNRLAANGALIAGSDVNLIAGQNLDNVGTLRASNNLAAQAGNDLVNSGLIEAGNRLDLLAGNTLVNKAGGIIAGRDVSLSATQDVINERTLTSHQSSNGSYAQQRDFVDNAARVEAANDLVVNAGRDVLSRGGVLVSGADTSIKAGRDVGLTSVAQVVSNDQGVRHSDSSVTQNGASLQAGRDLTISAGRDVSAVASVVEAKRDLAITAVGDLSLVSAANEQHSASKTRKVTSQEDHVQQVSSTVVAGGNLALKAGDDLTVSASQVTAGKEAYLYAGGDVNLVAEENSDYSYYRKTKTSSSGLSSSQKTRIDSSHSVTQEGASVSGDTVVVRARQDIAVSGSSVVSTHDTHLQAGRDIHIESATETFEQSHSTSKKKSGLLSSGGIGFTLGSTQMQHTSTSSNESAKASTVGSVLGDVSIEAGKNLGVKGSEVIAGRDINLIGQNVEIVAAESHNKSEQTSKSKSSGLTLALSGTVGSAIDTAYQTTKQATQEEDSRLAALQGIKAGLTGVQAWQAAQENGGMTAESAGDFVGIAISLGGQKSSSRQTQEQTVSQGSSLTSGNDLSVVATDGDIRVQGSQLKAGNNLSLEAERDLLLEAAANRQKLDGKNSSSGGAVGLSIGFGSNGGGLSIFANANKGSGNEKGNGTTWTETTLDAGNQASLSSGRDTTLKGAQVNADKIVADVGRDLTLQSLQDTDDYKSKQTNVSGGVSVTLIGYGASGSLSVSQTKLDSKYQSVQEQTGLFAGKGGYDIEVGKHTQLDGSVIASTADPEKNRLSTGTLGWSDIENKAEYKSQLASASVSGGNSGTTGFTSNMPSGMLIAANHSGSDSGTTSSAISNGTLEIRDTAAQQQDIATLSRDVENANGSISPIFDKEKEQRRLRQVQLIGEIGTQVSDIIRTEGLRKANQEGAAELEAQGIQAPPKGASDDELKQYNQQLAGTKAYQRIMGKNGTSGDYQRVTQAVTAALQGLAGGNIGGALAGASAPYVAQLIKKSTGDNAALNVMAHAVLGAVVAQAQGNSAAAGAAGAASGELAAHLIAQQLYGTSDGKALSEAQKETVSALATLAAGLAGAAVGGDLSGAVAAGQAGRNAAENNALSDIIENKAAGITQEEKYQRAQDELIRAVREFKAQNCAGLSSDACTVKMEAHQKELLVGAGLFGADFLPVVGTIKGFAEANSVEEYLLAAAAALPIGAAVGKVVKAGSKEAAEAAAKAKGAPSWDNAVSKADGDFGYLPPLRQNYVREVYDLQKSVDGMRASGASAEDIAKYAYTARHDLKLKYRDYTPPEMLEVIDARNMARYGNKIGPKFEDLLKSGKTFEQIIESSMRAGGGDIF